MGQMMLSDFLSVRWITLHGLVTTVTIMIYILTSHLLKQRRHPAAAIAWMLFIVLIPYLALPLFLSFGTRKLNQAIALSPNARLQKSQSNPWAVTTIEALGLDPPETYGHLNVHKDGHEAKRALLEVIGAAKIRIDLCTFLLAHDQLGAEVIELLCLKAKKGIQVRVLLDGLSHIFCLRPDLRKLRNAGVTCMTFVPPIGFSLRGRSNLRNHRKLVIADSGTSFARMWCGGRNLCAEYFEGNNREAPWRDLSFDLQGNLVAQANLLFEKDWFFAKYLRMMPALGTDKATVLGYSHQDRSALVADTSAQSAAQLVPSGPDCVDDTLHVLLLTAAYRAQERITIVTPYFVPDAALLMALCMAARRGVQIDLLVPVRSNHRLSDFARNRSIRALALAGGRILLSEKMQHAKLIIIDDVLALSGSANVDNRSLFLNYELMVAFHGRSSVLPFKSWFENEQNSAKPFTPSQPGLMRDLAEGMILWLGFQL
jgi:cardiolipin synthase A/B